MAQEARDDSLGLLWEFWPLHHARNTICRPCLGRHVPAGDETACGDPPMREAERGGP